ncbi:GxxExxY protein [Candidatus Sumerlaeota bacterium]|nr:GxxExxY protein [Candidatus Sumerlaeota bacterium]
MEKDLIEKDLSYRLQGAMMEVFNRLDPGFREETYKRALQSELRVRGIAFECERPIPISYRDEIIDEYRLDLLIEGRIIVELKAVPELHPRFEAQLLSYLKAAELELGYLVNFGSEKLIMKRILNPRLRRA